MEQSFDIPVQVESIPETRSDRGAARDQPARWVPGRAAPGAKNAALGIVRKARGGETRLR
jgi:hypothetical protein